MSPIYKADCVALFKLRQKYFLYKGKSNEGVFENRLEVVYKDNTLVNSSFTNENTIVVYSNDEGSDDNN